MKKIVLLVMTVLLSSACANQVKKDIAHEKNQVMDVETKEQMISKTREILESSPNLTEKQKEEFLNLHDEIISKAMTISIEIRKSKVVLLKAMTAKEYDKRKISAISKSLKKLHKEKINVMLEGMEKGREILGVSGSEALYKTWESSRPEFL